MRAAGINNLNGKIRDAFGQDAVRRVFWDNKGNTYTFCRRLLQLTRDVNLNIIISNSVAV
jgi:hypothetical protein